MNNFKFYFFVIAILSLGITSCSKDDDETKPSLEGPTLEGPTLEEASLEGTSWQKVDETDLNGDPSILTITYMFSTDTSGTISFEDINSYQSSTSNDPFRYSYEDSVVTITILNGKTLVGTISGNSMSLGKNTYTKL